jgi:hypothetical protein
LLHKLTALLPRLVGPTLVQRYVILRGCSLLLRIYESFLDVARQAEEGRFDIDVRFCRNLEEGDAKLVCEGLTLFGGYGALLFPVAFIADEDLVDPFARVLLDVGEPCSNICIFKETGLAVLFPDAWRE